MLQPQIKNYCYEIKIFTRFTGTGYVSCLRPSLIILFHMKKLLILQRSALLILVKSVQPKYLPLILLQKNFSPLPTVDLPRKLMYLIFPTLPFRFAWEALISVPMAVV